MYLETKIFQRSVKLIICEWKIHRKIEQTTKMCNKIIYKLWRNSRVKKKNNKNNK